MGAPAPLEIKAFRILEVQMLYGNILISTLKNRLRRFLSLTG